MRAEGGLDRTDPLARARVGNCVGEARTEARGDAGWGGAVEAVAAEKGIAERDRGIGFDRVSLQSGSQRRGIAIRTRAAFVAR